MFELIKFRASAYQRKGTGESRSIAESEANKFSPAGMLYSDRIVRQARAEFRPQKPEGSRGFKSPLAPPHSLRVQRFSAGFAENRRISGQFASLDRKSTRLNSSHANISYAV